jgi:dolichol-phosphate mannosyltransferase
LRLCVEAFGFFSRLICTLEENMKPRFSVVAPIYNEESLVEEFYRRVHAVMESLGEPWELVLVDDGSHDRSPDLLDQLHAQDPEHVVVLHFARNFGHQLAITAGMDYARGDAVIVIDADLQDPPEVIADLIAKWREGYEVVYAVRAERGRDHPPGGRGFPPAGPPRHRSPAPDA